jgi:hypothetical protein
MAASPAPKPKEAPKPVAAPKKMVKKGGGVPRAVIWGGLGLIVLFVGVFASLWFLSKGRPAHEEAQTPRAPAAGVQPPSAPSDGKETKPAGPGERTYRVKEGENLWAIARKGVLVDDPFEWRTIMVQNKDKIDYAFVSEETGEWKVLVESGEELRVKAHPPVASSEPVTKKYAIQLITVPEKQMPKALDLVKGLLSEGYYGYLYRIEDQGKAAFRVRVGFFETEAQAKEIAGQILAKFQGKLPQQYWVMIPSDRELRGELLEFGAQRAKPWVIELPVHGTHGEALEEMKAATGIGDFAYIAQGRGNGFSRYVYRTRIGFFATAQQAETARAQHQDKLPQMSQAQVVELKNFEETLPGQNFKLKGKKS